MRTFCCPSNDVQGREDFVVVTVDVRQVCLGAVPRFYVCLVLLFGRKLGVSWGGGKFAQGVPASSAGEGIVFFAYVLFPYDAGVVKFGGRKVVLTLPCVQTGGRRFVAGDNLRYIHPYERGDMSPSCFVTCLPTNFRSVVKNWWVFCRAVI